MQKLQTMALVSLVLLVLATPRRIRIPIKNVIRIDVGNDE
jgi:hypothetical protein